MRTCFRSSQNVAPEVVVVIDATSSSLPHNSATVESDARTDIAIGAAAIVAVTRAVEEWWATEVRRRSMDAHCLCFNCCSPPSQPA